MGKYPTQGQKDRVAAILAGAAANRAQPRPTYMSGGRSSRSALPRGVKEPTFAQAHPSTRGSSGGGGKDSGGGLDLGFSPGDIVGEVLKAVDTPRAVVTAAMRQMIHGERQLLGYGGPAPSWDTFTGDIGKHLGAGQIMSEALQNVDKQGYGTGEIFGNKILDMGVGFGMDVAVDPATFVAPETVLAGGREAVAARLVADDTVKAISEKLAARSGEMPVLEVARGGGWAPSIREGEAAAKEMAAKVLRDGKSALTREDLDLAFGATGGAKFNVPGTGRVAKALHLTNREHALQLPLLPKSVTDAISAPARVVGEAVGRTKLGEGFKKFLSGVNPELDAAIKSGSVDAFKAKRYMQTNAMWGEVYKGKKLDEYAAMSRNFKGHGEDIVRAIEGDTAAAGRLAEAGIDHTALQAQLHEMATDMIEAGVPINEIDDYFPGLITPEAKAQMAKSQSLDGGKAFLLKQRKMVAGAKLKDGTILEGTRADIKRTVERYARDNNLGADFYEKNPDKVMPTYITAVSRTLAKHRTIQDLARDGIVVNAREIATVPDKGGLSKIASLLGKAGRAEARGQAKGTEASLKNEGAAALRADVAGATAEATGHVRNVSAAAERVGERAGATPDLAQTLADMQAAKEAARNPQPFLGEGLTRTEKQTQAAIEEAAASSAARGTKVTAEEAAPPETVFEPSKMTGTKEQVEQAATIPQPNGRPFATVAHPKTLSGWKLHIAADTPELTADAAKRVYDVVEARGMGMKIATPEFHAAVEGTGQAGKGVTIYLPRQATAAADQQAVVDAMKGWTHNAVVADEDALGNGVFRRWELKDGAPPGDLTHQEYQDWYAAAGEQGTPPSAMKAALGAPAPVVDEHLMGIHDQLMNHLVRRNGFALSDVKAVDKYMAKLESAVELTHDPATQRAFDNAKDLLYRGRVGDADAAKEEVLQRIHDIGSGTNTEQRVAMAEGVRVDAPTPTADPHDVVSALADHENIDVSDAARQLQQDIEPAGGGQRWPYETYEARQQFLAAWDDKEGLVEIGNAEHAQKIAVDRFDEAVEQLDNTVPGWRDSTMDTFFGPRPKGWPEYVTGPTIVADAGKDATESAAFGVLDRSNAANANLADVQARVSQEVESANADWLQAKDALDQGVVSPGRRELLEHQEWLLGRRTDLLKQLAKETDPATRRAGVLEAQGLKAESESLAQYSSAKALRAEAAGTPTTKQVNQAIEAVQDGAYKTLTARGDLAAPADVADALNRISKVATPDGMRKFLKHYDNLLNYIKAWQIATPGFHVRNFMGGVFNNYLADMEIGAYRRFIADRAAWHAGAENPLMDEIHNTIVMRGQYGSSEIETGAHHAFDVNRVNPLSSKNEWLNINRAAGGKVEELLRGTLAYDVMRKGGKIEDAVASVSRYHFNYADLSNFERGTVKRVIPFYTWTRHNFPLQLQMIVERPGKYARYYQAKTEIETGTNPEGIVPAYYSDLFGIHTPFKIGGADAYITPDLPFTQTMAAPLPLDDNGKFSLGAPLGMVTPILKTPIERAMNHQYFKDIPFTDKKRDMPTSWSAIPGLKLALQTIGMADSKGRMKDRDSYLVESWMPLLGRTRRLLPSQEHAEGEPKEQKGKFEQRALASVLGVLGVPLRTNTDFEKKMEKYRRSLAKTHELKIRVPNK